MTKKSSATAFLENMKQDLEAEKPLPVAHEKAAQGRGKLPAATRKGLKHIGGYFNRDMVEKIAILRARLGLDNSRLIEVAINELYSKHQAQRAFSEN